MGDRTPWSRRRVWIGQLGFACGIWKSLELCKQRREISFAETSVATVGFALSERYTSSSHGHEMIAACASLLAELDFVGITAEVGVERKGNEVLVYVIWINLFSGEPPGSI